LIIFGVKKNKNKIMKKIFVILSLICFVAVNLSSAQTPQASAKETKKEAVAKADEKGSMPACCKGKSAASCADHMKNCTPAQRAACEKACSHGDKAKADAGTEKKDGTKANNN
jgi:hypothetical protein